MADDPTIRELRNQYEDAKEIGDDERAAEFWEQLKKYVKPTGQRRKVQSSSTEKARRALSAAYHSVLEKLHEPLLELEDHLRRTMRVGVVSCYRPEPHSQAWFVAPHTR